MRVLNRLDFWLGKTLFYPPIIWLCQVTRQTQYAVYRALWFFAACHATFYPDIAGWVWATLMWCGVVFMLIDASVHPDRPVQSSVFWRLLWWILLAISLGSGLYASACRSLMVLFAEYAATIRTIPPRQKRERQGRGKEAFDGQ